MNSIARIEMVVWQVEWIFRKMACEGCVWQSFWEKLKIINILSQTLNKKNHELSVNREEERFCL